MVNDVHHHRDYHEKQYCPKCEKETEHKINEVAIWTTATCTICGYYVTEPD